MRTIHFNTGRKYTANGQPITATLHDDMVVTFMDHGRGVDGQFTIYEGWPFDQTVVMGYYDSGKAISTKRSWQDGMQRGGCNSQFIKGE